MPPKAKKKTAKQLVEELTRALAAEKGERAASEAALRDANYALVSRVEHLKQLCMRHQNEFDAQHEAAMRATLAELGDARAAVAALEVRLRAAAADGAALEAAREERAVMLRQMAEAALASERTERRCAEEVHNMHVSRRGVRGGGMERSARAEGGVGRVALRRLAPPRGDCAASGAPLRRSARGTSWAGPRAVKRPCLRPRLTSLVPSPTSPLGGRS